MTSISSPRLGRAAAALLAAGLLAACSSASRSPTPSPAPSSSAAPTALPTATGTPTPAPAPSPTPIPTPPPGVVPAGFAPLSVTFVSPSTGFVLGTYPCSATDGCLSLLRSNDSGHSWTPVAAPPTKPARGESMGVHIVRFADARNGWAFGNELWSTHDGAAHWSRVALPGAASGGAVQSLEASGGLAHALVIGGTGNGSPSMLILDSSASNDTWTLSPTSVPIGAGPVPQGQLALQDGYGWAIEVDRTVVGGARLSGGRWSSWQPPCASGGGAAWITAASTSRLAAVCDEGEWVGPVGVHVYLSSNGGASFTRIAAALPTGSAGGIAYSSSGALVVGASTSTNAELLASFDGGSTWTAVFEGGMIFTAGELGFTTATQGVAIEERDGGSTLLMTFDGGHHWSPVTF